MPHLSFDIDIDLPEDVTFDVVLKRADGSVAGKETFQCVGRAPLAAFAYLRDAANGGVVATTNGITDFFRSVLVDGDIGRFESLAADKTVLVTADDLVPIVRGLIEVMTQGPTSGLSGSPDGPDTNGPTSTAGAPSTVSTPAG